MEWEVSRQVLKKAMYETLTKSSTYLPKDVRNAIEEAKSREQEEIACLHLDTLIANADLVEREGLLACSDTGWTLFYVKIGDNVRIEGGYSALYEVAREVVGEATKNAKLRATLIHPLTQKNPGNNIGPYFPKVEIKFDPNIDYIEIIAIPKGGGSEIFGTFFKMMVIADGIEGAKKFVLDSVVQGSYAGKTCPPNIIGVGIGGSADVCMKIAKEACVLRPIGVRHPDPDIAKLEVELMNAINSLGVGPMGSPGKTCVFDVHVECAMTHTAALAVAVNTQCSLGRRALVRISRDGSVEFDDKPQWEYRG